jgi:trehalose 6-phosphate synthase
MEPDREAMRQHCEALQAEFFANRALIIAANRAPVSFGRNRDGELHYQRGGGGLVTALTDLCRRAGATTWIACARTATDVEWDEGQISLDGGGSVKVEFLSPSEAAYDGYYNVIANPLLWFLQHSM